jgi:hypothetical protein
MTVYRLRSDKSYEPCNDEPIDLSRQVSIPTAVGSEPNLQRDIEVFFSPGSDFFEISQTCPEVLLPHVLQRVSASACGSVARVDLTVGANLVNMGMKFQTVLWRAAMLDPRLPDEAGVISLWRGKSPMFNWTHKCSPPHGS